MTASNPFLLGITGTIASGKSAVGRMLESRGIPVIDSDKVVHELLAKDGKTIAEIREQFGAVVIGIDGAVDRKALGAVVFNDQDKRKKLESIIHPNVKLKCKEQVRVYASRGASLVALLVPLLFEAGMEREYDAIWSVYTEPKVLKERLKERDNMSESEAQTRIDAHLPQDEKARRATDVIDNSGTLTSTEQQVAKLLDKITVGVKS